MRGRNFSKTLQRTKYIAVDFLTAFLSFFLFNIVRYFLLVENWSSDNSFWPYVLSTKLIIEQILIPIGMLGIYWISGYYNNVLSKSRVTEFSETFWSAVVSTVIIYLILLINDSSGMKTRDYEIILSLFGIIFTLTYIGRVILTSHTIRQLRKRNWIYSTLIIGNSRKSREALRKLKEGGSVWAYNVVGFINLDKEHSVNDSHQTWNWDEIEEVCRRYEVDQLILAPERIRDSEIMHILERLFPLGLPVRIAPDTLSYVTGNIKLNDIMGVPLIDLTSPRLSNFEKNVKRTFDVLVSIISMIVLSPVFATAAIGVKLSSKGPVIYSQERMGKGHKPFRILKFRSMYVSAEDKGPQLSSKDDRRITSFGKLLRKYRIDELPQFYNVLKGDMSLVGPRPEREYYIEQIIKRAPYYGLIFQVRPGVTSWGMVKYGYASSVTQMVERSRYDLLYINNMSISTDLKILIYTIRTVLKGAGL